MENNSTFLLAQLLENSPLAVIEWDSDFRVSRWSRSAERLFGWKAEEVLGKHVNDVRKEGCKVC